MTQRTVQDKIKLILCYPKWRLGYEIHETHAGAQILTGARSKNMNCLTEQGWRGGTEALSVCAKRLFP